jgi:hypothetical protein
MFHYVYAWIFNSNWDVSWKTENWGSVLRKERNYSFLHSIQSGSGTHPAFCPMDTIGSFPRSKAARV